MDRENVCPWLQLKFVYSYIIIFVVSAIQQSGFLRPGARFLKVPNFFRARKDIRKTPTRVFGEAALFISCKGNKNENNCKVSCLETPSFCRYKENDVTRKFSGLLRNRPQAMYDTGSCFGR